MVGECVAIVVGLCWKPWVLWRYYLFRNEVMSEYLYHKTL
jgi:hypothetical protein